MKEKVEITCRTAIFGTVKRAVNFYVIAKKIQPGLKRPLFNVNVVN